MNAALVVKLRPTGPWRIGPDSGARNRVDAIYHSDSLYAAVTSAMARLGLFEEWLDATARRAPAGTAVAFGSGFPFLKDTLFVAPPRTIWPPTAPAMLSARLRWKSARFVPLSVVQALLAGQPLDENQWDVDGPSECLVPAGDAPSGPGPFRSGLRWSAAVDRLTGATERHSTACTEFSEGAGLWTVVSFAGDATRDRWLEPVKTAFRWLADSGFGGERSRGWGRSETPEFIEGSLPGMILDVARPQPPAPAEGESEPAPRPGPARPLPHWLLSLFTPDDADQVDWSRGNYALVTRAGRVDTSGELKKSMQMVAEGSVLFAAGEPRGGAPDVAPEGCAHPVYRAGFAVAIPLPEAN